GAATQVHQGAQSDGVHLRHQRRQRRVVPRQVLVTVHVDERKPGLSDFGLLSDEHRMRLVLLESHGRRPLLLVAAYLRRRRERENDRYRHSADYPCTPAHDHGVPPSYFTSPPTIVYTTRAEGISLSGIVMMSFERTVMSAYLPVEIDPSSSSWKLA